MAQEVLNTTEEVLLGEEIDHVRLITLNRPRHLNVIAARLVSLLAGYLEKWEKDDEAELVIIKGAGRAFSAGGYLKMFYDGRTESNTFNLQQYYINSRIPALKWYIDFYWLCNHINTYKKYIGTKISPCEFVMEINGLENL